MKTNRFRTHRHGVTLTDLCIVLVMIAIVLAVFPVLRQNAFERDNRINCMHNLRNIAAALITYSNSNNGKYPRTYFDPKAMNTTEYTRANAINPFGPGGPSPNDVTAPIFLLMRYTGMDMKVLVCPSSDADVYDPMTDGQVQARSNFTSRRTFSYSFGNPYPTHAALVSQWVWDSTLSSDFAIASDMNPGTAVLTSLTFDSPADQLRLGNSLNHDGAGQNVLYGDYHVGWQTSPFCGDHHSQVSGDRDNIFTAATSPPTIGGMPQDLRDSVVVPVATAGEQPPAKMRSSTRLQLIYGGVVVFLGLFIGIISILRARKKVAKLAVPDNTAP